MCGRVGTKRKWRWAKDMEEDKDRVEGAANRKHVQAKLRTITGQKRTVLHLPPAPRFLSKRKRIITLNFPPKKQRKRKRSERILIF